MNILQVEKFYWHQGGASNYALYLSEQLRQAGHVVVPFSTLDKRNGPSGYARFFVRGEDFGRFKNMSWRRRLRAAANLIYSLEAKRQITKLLAEVKIDVAHIHNIYHHLSPSILPVLKSKNIPVIMTAHDHKLISPNYLMWHHGKIHAEDARRWHVSCLFNKCLKDSYGASALAVAEMIWHHKIKKYYERYVDKIIAPSLYLKNLLISHGYSENQVVHLPSPAEFNNDEIKPGNYAAYVGRLAEEKGLRVLIQAAKLTPQINYKIIGHGPLWTELMAQLKVEKINNVELCGYKIGADLNKLIAGARILATPSLCPENYPLTVLEAKTRGKVNLASAGGGLPELLPKEMLVEAGDVSAWARALSDWFSRSDAELKIVGEKLRLQAREQNDPQKHLDKILEIYQLSLREGPVAAGTTKQSF